MAKKRAKYQKMTPEERAARKETNRMVAERIAYHTAKARQEEQAQQTKSA
jgi:hypothetical protein